MSAVDENADDPMIVRTMDKGKFVRVNDSFQAKVGFDAAELTEKHFLDWIDPRDRASVQAALENDERSFFARHITRDGNSLQLRIQLTTVRLNHEQIQLVARCALGVSVGIAEEGLLDGHLLEKGDRQNL